MPLRYLFVDMNAFFASVEQQDDRRLRGKPVAVVSVVAETTSCIAASYEAKRHGVKTGTPVWKARELCPGIICRPGRHERYVEVHHELVRAVGRCLPVTKIMSVDEVLCRLLGEEAEPARAVALGQQIKAEIRRRFDYLTCSVGVAPNGLLAKVGADMRKPDGLTVIRQEDLPDRLYHLDITDFPGIGPRMGYRLRQFGISTVGDLYRQTPEQMCRAWGSRVHGWRWWWLLRGEDLPDLPTKRRTVGHSHVLPPELRTDVGAWGVLIKLIHKAAARLRRMNYWANRIELSVSHLDAPPWGQVVNLPGCQDTLTMIRAARQLWAQRPEQDKPLKVAFTLTGLVPAHSATPSLFDNDRRLIDLCHIMDRVNRAFGPNSLFFGGMFATRETAPMRIPFNAIPTPDPAVHTGTGSQRRWSTSNV